MKKKDLKTIHLKKCLIANMTTYQMEALKGGTRTNIEEENSVLLTICPGHMHCVNNMSI